jgi:hypothetical protein
LNTLTIWQIAIQSDKGLIWRPAIDAKQAAQIAGMRPGAVRLVDVPTPTRFAWARYHDPAPRPITRRRLAAAERRLRIERDKTPLFAEHVAAEQPTPEQRIAAHDAQQAEYRRRDRRQWAAQWRECRAQLAAMPADQRPQFLLAWNNGYQPKDPVSLLDALRTWRIEHQDESPWHDNATCINYYPPNTDWTTCSCCKKPIQRFGPTDRELKEQRKRQREINRSIKRIQQGVAA